MPLPGWPMQPRILSTASPGDVLRWEDISSADIVASNRTIPSGLSLSRFLYVTEDVDGKPIPASGWALLPYENVWSDGKKGQNKLRTVVWTRGTTGGQNPSCATSNHQSLGSNCRMPFILAQAGYAVIAPDYAGQGVKIPQGFQYTAGWLHAGDSGYSLAAARKVIGSMLTDEWVVYGFSEGGQTAWRTNERMGTDPTMAKKAGKLIGTVAVAPPLRPGNPSAGSAQPSIAMAKNQAYFMQSLAAAYPDKFNMSDFMNEKGRERLGVLDATCLSGGAAAWTGLSVSDVFTGLSPVNSSVYSDWSKRYNNPGPHLLASPMLAMHGLVDTIVPVAISQYDYNQTCTALPNSQIQYRQFQGLSHFQTLEASKPFGLRWVQERFDGVSAPKGCSQVQVSPLTDYDVTAAFDWQGTKAGSMSLVDGITCVKLKL